MNEIKVISNVGSLIYDFQQLNKEVDNYIEKYKGLVIAQDQITDAKKIRAELNKNKKELNDRKIVVKKEFMKPYIEFENQVKEVMAKIDDVSSIIDEQIKNIEQQEKDTKTQDILDYFNKFEINYINFDLIFQDKWLNKGIKTFDWQSEMTNIINSIKTNMKVIDNRPDSNLLKPLYLKCLNLDYAMQELEDIQKQQKVLLNNETNIALDTGSMEVDKDTGEIVDVQEEYLTRNFKVVATLKQLNELTYFMKENNIFFERSL